MKEIQHLTWADRFVLIDAFTPTDQQICATFRVHPDELQVARQIRSGGNLMRVSVIDPQNYKEIFTMTPTPIRSTAAIITGPTADSADTVTVISSSPKEKKNSVKTGPKTSKIHLAFANIPSTPTPADEFTKTHGVSLAVLRQSKRFDDSGAIGKVNVRRDKNTKQIMVWRG